MTEILLHTKLGVPPKRSVTVTRHRLLEYASKGLMSGSDFMRKLTLVSAPAGYGKTTLVAEWLHGLEMPIAWLSLDEADNDPNRFMAYLVAAFQSARPGFRESIQAMFQSPQHPPEEIILTILLNEIVDHPSPIILVLDDYHAINNIAIHRQIAFLLEHLPSRMHIALITREDPLISLSRLRASNQVLEIRQDALRFGMDEIMEFMQQVMQLELAEDDIVALDRRTEGWIAGLQLAALSLREASDKNSFIQSFTGSNRYVLEYLIEEVFSQQPAEMQDFLLKTALLDRLSGSLCDAVRETTGSRELLEKLEQSNMFIMPLDQSREWYRYHPLFSELLRHQQHLAGQVGDEAGLHRRASLWFEAEGYLPEAIGHSLAAQDWTKAAQLIGRVNERMFKQGEVLTLISWLSKLPQEITLSQPGLCMVYAWALLLAGKYEQAKPVLEQAEKLAQPGSAFLGQVAIAQAYMARSIGDNPGVIERSQLALALIPETDITQRGTLLMNLGMAYWHEGRLEEAETALIEAQEQTTRSGNLYAQLTSELFLARTLASRGELHESAQRYPSIIQRGPQVPVVALAYADLGVLHYEWDELETAESYVLQGLDLSLRMRNVEFQIANLIVRIRILLAHQDWNGALSIADQICRLARDFSRQTQARCAACHAEVALAMGDLKSAANWLGKVSEGVDAHPFFRFLGLLRPRSLIAQGENESAAVLLEACYQNALHAGWGYGLIAVRTLQALSAKTTESAHEYLVEALLKAQPEGYIRTFVEAGVGLVPLLRDAAQHGVLPEYVGRILGALGSRPRYASPGQSMLVEKLSERELEVLRLVTAGLSNREIAGKLFISPGTAKTHIHNLCGKLGVRNRTEAVTRARELNLV